MMPPLPVTEPDSRLAAAGVPPPVDARSARQAFVAAVVAAVAGAALYLPHLDAGFTSEDFLILARLSGEDLATTARRELASAWLGLETVGFWRPISTLLLGIELRLLGLDATKLHALHLLVHAINAILVASIVVRVVRPRGRPVAAAAVAVLFAIHPFHPSAVLFTGAFATLHGATFSLVAMLCFLIAATDAPRSRRLGLEMAALGSFVLALGSYEASAVVPAVLLVAALLLPGARGSAWRTAPFFGVLALWLLARLAVLGTPVGGYDDLRARFLAAPLERAADASRAARRLLHPAFDARAGIPEALVALALAVLVGASVVAALTAGNPAATKRKTASTARDTWRGAVLGLAWTALFLAPFGFVGIVPANGRYAYLAVAGVLLVVTGLAAALVGRWPRAGAVVAVIAVSVLAADWRSLLRHHLEANDAASAQVQAVRAEVLRIASETSADALLLIEDHPDFVESALGAPIAKALQYGLAESLRPPFGALDRTVLPMPASITAGARAALGTLRGAARYRWDAASGTLTSVAPSIPPPPALGILVVDASGSFLDVSCAACTGARLVVLTAAMPFVAAPISTGEGRARFAAPIPFLRGIASHQRGPAFFWVEEQATGVPTSLSAIGRISLDADPVSAFVAAAAKIRRDQGTETARSRRGTRRNEGTTR